MCRQFDFDFRHDQFAITLRGCERVHVREDSGEYHGETSVRRKVGVRSESDDERWNFSRWVQSIPMVSSLPLFSLPCATPVFPASRMPRPPRIVRPQIEYTALTDAVEAVVNKWEGDERLLEPGWTPREWAVAVYAEGTRQGWDCLDRRDQDKVLEFLRGKVSCDIYSPKFVSAPRWQNWSKPAQHL